jgi:hypothetical protein
MPVTKRQVSLGGAVPCDDVDTPAADMAQPARPQPPAVRRHPDVGDEEKLEEIFADANLPNSARQTAVEHYLSDATFEKYRNVLTCPVLTGEEFKNYLDFLHRLFPYRSPYPKWRTLQELKDACHKFGIYRAVWADRPENMHTWHSAILERLMHTDTYPTATSNLLKPLMKRGQNAVPILAGESGAGKTHHLLTCDADAVTVYVLSLPGALKSVETVAEELKEAEDLKWVEGVAQFVTAAVLKGRVPPSEWDLHLILAFDEMGRQTTAVRMLCRCRDALRRRVKELCHAQSVRLIAGGTGVEMHSRPGSMPDSYKLMILKPDPSVWQAYVNSQAHPPALRKVLDVISEALPGLVCNARAAVILKRRIEDLIKALSVEAEVAQLLSSIDLLLAQVSLRYKYMNAMSRLDPDETRDCCADAFRAVHCRLTATNLSEPTLIDLVAVRGLITDKRRTQDFETQEEFDRAYDKEHEICSRPGARETISKGTDKWSFHLTPTEGRFEMSAAIGLMILSRFGLQKTNFNRAICWETLEELVTAKIVLAFALTNTLNEALEALQIPLENQPNIPLDGDVVKLRLDHGNSQLDHGEKEWMEEIANIGSELRTKAGTVVIINTRGGPYGDIIVAVNGWLGLFQTKDAEGERIQFDEEQMKRHLLKNDGHWLDDNVTRRLREITGTFNKGRGPYPDFVFVAPNQQTRVPSQSVAPYRVHVMDGTSNFLKPFLWPSTTAYVGRETIKGKTSSVALNEGELGRNGKKKGKGGIAH